MNLGGLRGWSRRIAHHDDRGSPIVVMAMRELQGAPAQQDPRIERLMDSAAAQIQSAMPIWVGALVGMSFPLGLIPLIWLLRNSLPIWAIAPPYFLVVMALTTAWVRRRLRSIAPGLVSTFAEEGVCAACGYNLHGVTANADFLICPDCGAAWQAARVRRTAPIVTTSQEPLLRQQARRGFRVYVNSLDRRTAKDDAGRLYAPIRVRAMRALRRSATGEHRSALAEAIRSLRYKGALGRVLAAGLLLGMAALAGIPPFMSLLRLRTWMALPGLFPVLMFALLAIAVLASDMGRPTRKVVAVLRSLGLCPGCGRSIRGLPAGEDGMVRCPTCLCAWSSRWSFDDATT